MRSAAAIRADLKAALAKYDAATTDEDKDAALAEAQGFKAELDAVLKAEGRASGIEDLRAFLREPAKATPVPAQPTTHRGAGGAPAGGGKDAAEEARYGFASLGDFVRAVRFNPGDSRIRELSEGFEKVRAESGSGTPGDQNMTVPADGGVLVPPQFRQELLSVEPEAAIFRPRATVIPAGFPPDAELTIPTLDQSGSRGVYAGVEVSWIAEGDEKPRTKAAFDDVKLKPYEVAGHIVITDKLLRNAPASSAVLQKLLRGAVLAAEEDAFLNGPGTTRPTGLIGHGSTIEIGRAEAGKIKYTDLVSMYARRLLNAGAYTWLYSQTALPELMTMEDPAGSLVWQGSAREGEPDRILGIPALPSPYSPELGDVGDLVLAALGMYLIKDGSGLAVAASEHVFFTKNKTVIKVFWNVDGKPWLTTPIQTPKGSTVSPFIVLGDESGS